MAGFGWTILKMSTIDGAFPTEPLKIWSSDRSSSQRRTSPFGTVPSDFRPTAPNRLWVADLSEVATWDGKLYLAVVIDAFSRRCVGWAKAEHMRAELVVEALEMAIWRRQPARGLVHHSDKGGQYVSLLFGQRCRQAGINVSMGARGYRRCGPPYGRASATTAAPPPQTRVAIRTGQPSPAVDTLTARTTVATTG